MLVRVPQGRAEDFADTFSRALHDLMAVAVQGSDPEQVGDPRLERFRGFFRPPITPENNDRQLQAWRGMSEAERASYERITRWDLGNVLHRLEPTMREWRPGQVEVTGPDTVVVQIEGDEMGGAQGVIRQIVEFAGGELVDVPEPEHKPFWAFWR